MGKIELLFGGPTTLREEIAVEDYAYGRDTSIETAVIRQFHNWIEFLFAKRTDKDDGFFELLLFIDTNQMLKLPRISAGIYRHRGFVLPKMIIHGDHGVDKETRELIFLSERHINIIGNNFEEHIEYEYFEFQRSGLIKTKKDQSIYLLGSQPHIYDAGKFYKAKVG